MLCPKTDRRASVCALPENRSPRRKWPRGGNFIRKHQLISFNNLALDHLYPHLIPHPRACSSSRPRPKIRRACPRADRRRGQLLALPLASRTRVSQAKSLILLGLSALAAKAESLSDPPRGRPREGVTKESLFRDRGPLDEIGAPIFGVWGGEKGG